MFLHGFAHPCTATHAHTCKIIENLTRQLYVYLQCDTCVFVKLLFFYFRTLGVPQKGNRSTHRQSQTLHLRPKVDRLKDSLCYVEVADQPGLQSKTASVLHLGGGKKEQKVKRRGGKNGKSPEGFPQAPPWPSSPEVTTFLLLPFVVYFYSVFTSIT